MSSFTDRLKDEQVKFDMQQAYNCFAILNTEDSNKLKKSIKSSFKDCIVEPQLSGIVLSEQEVHDVKGKINDVFSKYLILAEPQSKTLPQTLKDQLRPVLKDFVLHVDKELGAASVTMKEVELPSSEKKLDIN